MNVDVLKASELPEATKYHFFYFEEMSVKEICEVTGRKASTVTSQLTRGREMLKKKLKEEYRYE